MNKKFTENITNDELMLLPVGRFEGRTIVVDTEEGIRQACEYLSGHEVIGFDTETKPSFKAGVINKVALLQLSAGDRCYLFRLSKMKLDKSIVKILESKKIIKVGADVQGDLRALQRLRRFRPQGFVDLQHIASEWGIAEKSVRKMAAIVLGIRITKAQRLSNWEAATLTEPQKCYAATDAWTCLEMYHKLNSTEKNASPDNT